MLVFNGKKYFVPFFNGGSGQDISLCNVTVSNRCSNSDVRVFNQHKYLGTPPDCFLIVKDEMKALSTAKKLPMYIIGDRRLNASCNDAECQCITNYNVVCVLIDADNTEIEVFDSFPLTDYYRNGIDYYMNTEVITSPLDFATVEEINEWNEVLANAPIHFGGVVLGVDMGDRDYSHISFAIDGDTWYIRDVDSDTVICEVVDGVPNWKRSSRWFFPSYSSAQNFPLSFLDWLNNNSESAYTYQNVGNMVAEFARHPDFSYGWGSEILDVPFTDEVGNEYSYIAFMEGYEYKDENGITIHTDYQILLDGTEPIYGIGENGIEGGMSITFGDNVYLNGYDYPWFWSNVSLYDPNE